MTLQCDFRARNLAVTLSMKDDEEDDGLDECMLVMKPCDPAITTDEDQCLDEEVFLSFSCVQKQHFPTWRRNTESLSAPFPPLPSRSLALVLSAYMCIHTRTQAQAHAHVHFTL